MAQLTKFTVTRQSLEVEKFLEKNQDLVAEFLIGGFTKQKFDALAAHKLADAERLLECFVNEKIQQNPEHALRWQYQPLALTTLLLSMVEQKPKALKFHIDCGGGKTLIFMVALLLLIEAGVISKIAIVAPTKALLRQLQLDFANYRARYHQLHPAKFCQEWNISSDAPEKNKLTQEEQEDEDRDSSTDQKQEIEQTLAQVASATGIKLVTTLNHTKIQTALKSKDIVLFFVCLPSFFNSFIPCVKAANAKIDVTVFDEYHNLAQLKEHQRVLLLSYAEFSPSRWSWSATPKYGKVHSIFDQYVWGCGHAFFGTEALGAKVRAHQLREWGYLVKNVYFTLMRSSKARKIEEAVKDWFSIFGGEELAGRGYAEIACIVEALKFLVKRGVVMKAITFSSAVPLIKKMFTEQGFLAKLMEIDPAFEEVFLITGSTPPEQRSKIFVDIKDMADGSSCLLLQHSTCGEGVNCPNFNVAFIFRGMGQVQFTQAYSRVTRSAPGKDSAYVFIYVEDDDPQDGMKLKELGKMMHYAVGGLVEDQIIDLFDKRHGGGNNANTDPTLNAEDVVMGIKDLKVSIEEDTLPDFADLVLAGAQEEIDEEAAAQIDAMSDDELIEHLLA